MKKLFRRKSSDPTVQRRPSLPASLDYDLIYPLSQDSDRAERGMSTPDLTPNPYTAQADTTDSTAASLASVALSDSSTIAIDETHRLDLQPTYQDNFTAYIPFLVRRSRLERRRAAEARSPSPSNAVGSDDETICEVTAPRIIMDRPLEQYDYKRQMVLATEFIKNTTYVFPDAESFRLFKQLKSQGKKSRKRSVIVYDENSNIRRFNYPANKKSTPPVTPGSVVHGGKVPTRPPLSSKSPSSSSIESAGSNPLNGLGQDYVSIHETLAPGRRSMSGAVVDNRHHLIPIEHKVKGTGLPLFKVVVPYMSSFRKKTPFMIFRRYKEVPERPAAVEGEESEHFETYDFCTIHTKNFQHFKRYTFHFHPQNAPPYKLLAFQNNYRPFTDFRYKNTRFRVFGTSIAMAYLMSYNPELRIFVLDDDQPSLADGLVEKKPKGDIFKSRKGSPGTNVPESPGDPTEFANPVPSDTNPIIMANIDSIPSGLDSKYIPNESPPFGRFIDALAYHEESSVLPKKYSESGKVDLYQSVASVQCSDMTSTLSVDLDSLTLSVVLLTLRENNVRTTKYLAHPTSRFGLVAFPSGRAGTGVLNTSFS